jgi:protein TonB
MNNNSTITLATITSLAFCFFIFSSFIFSKKPIFENIVFIQNDTIPLKDHQPLNSSPKLEEEVIIIVDVSPQFPGCEHLDLNKVEKESCAQKKMLEFIYGNLKYPIEARKNGTQGQVVVQLVVTKEGYIENIILVRDVKDGCGEAAVAVVQLMNELPERWTPGMQEGKPVNVKYTLPVKFKLEDSPKKKRSIFKRKN